MKLRVPHHNLNQPAWSGAACAQMVLSSKEVAVDLRLLPSQQSLFTEAQNHGLHVWDNCDPVGLCWIMENYKNDKKGGIFKYYGGHFDVVAGYTNAPGFTSHLIWVIDNFKVPPIVLAFPEIAETTTRPLDRFGQWVAVVGYEPKPGGGIEKLYVHSPWTDKPVKSKAHTNDVTVASGGAAIADVAESDGCGPVKPPGKQVHDIPYATWINDYLKHGHTLDVPSVHTGVPSAYEDNHWGGPWGGKLVTISDPNVPTNLEGETVPEPEPTEIIPGEEARNCAELWKTEKEKLLVPDDEWALALADTTAGTPLLVDRIDLPNRVYYIVPFARPNGDVPALVSVSAYYSGGVKEALGVTAGTTHFAQAVDRERLFNGGFGKRTVEIDGNEIPLRKEDLQDHLVWAPCYESGSPYWPFYLFRPDPNTWIWVRIDGEVFTQLHGGIG